MHSSKTTKELYQLYKEQTQKAADLGYASAVLGWDQEVHMPEKGFEHRGRQLATLASLVHDMVTSADYGALLEELNGRADLEEGEKDNVRLSLEDYTKNKKLPSKLVEQLTEQTSASYSAWIKARKNNDYSLYAKELERMITLTKEKVEKYGYEDHPYDALLDEYEKGATVAMLDPIFEKVKENLHPLLKSIKEAAQVDNDFLFNTYPQEQQWDFSLDVLKAMGYDFKAGRQDLSEHPFTTSFSPLDVRVTTRVDEKDFASLLWSSIHEGGHALYEQGLPVDQYGLPLGEATSLSIHESQSRLWENCVGRDIHFWKHFFPKLQEYFPGQLQDVHLVSFYKGMNKVQPSLIRTESDEVTYHFHVLIRYEIEKALIGGELAVKDLRDAWNDKYEHYLGVRPQDDKTGVLQDVHWAHGSFGYFPTYSLGSFYAAQFYEQACKELKNLPTRIEHGEFEPLLDWLRDNVHIHGRKYRSEELCEKITGRPLDFTCFMSYVKRKYAGIYAIEG